MSVLAVATFSVQAEEGTIRIGWTAWSSTEATTNIAKQILENRLGYKVDMILADIGLQYQGVAKGDIDVMLMSWLPVTHAAYIKKVGDQIVDLGVLFRHARLGWVVPDYVPESELKSIEDLKKPEVRNKLNGLITGIDPGAGLMEASEKAIKQYGLNDYTLVSSSGAGMTAALGRAVQRDQWIVVTGWSPHWMFARWKLHYLEDPKGALGGEEKCHIQARQGFKEDFPKAAAFLEHYTLPIDDLQAVMYEATQSSYEEAAKKYIENHPKRVDEWLQGVKTD